MPEVAGLFTHPEIPAIYKPLTNGDFQFERYLWDTVVSSNPHATYALAIQLDSPLDSVLAPSVSEYRCSRLNVRHYLFTSPAATIDWLSTFSKRIPSSLQDATSWHNTAKN
jgi:hypothetical protein